jgi:Ser/Thr protein kinase RdoA (MazF antagonist)
VESGEPTSPPAAVLEAAGLRPEGLALIPWRHRLWTAEVGDRPAVLHRYPAWRPPQDVAWEHAFLRRLAATGFPAPRPLDAFAGESWLAAAGAVWGLVSFLPGRTLEWAPRPDLREVGALLARYHDAAAGVPMEAPRPSRVRLAKLGAAAGAVPEARLRAALGGAAGARLFREHVERVQRELDALGHAAAPQLVIHGDPTVSNVVVDGTPPAVTGLIDFASAYHEPPLADVSFGLWRSGRSEQAAEAVDPERVRRLVAGYHSVRSVDARTGPAALCTYMRARGLQYILHHLGGEDLSLPLRRVAALGAGQPALEAAIAAALAAPEA